MGWEDDFDELEERYSHRLIPYLREEMLPTVFCEGCGCGTVLNGYAHAMDELGIRSEDLISVTGIGCSSWIPSRIWMPGPAFWTTAAGPVS